MRGVVARVALSSVPLLEGAQSCVQAGIFSSLQPSNLRLTRAVHPDSIQEHSASPAFSLLFDPQTSGGLLFSVPSDHADALLSDIHGLGADYAAASVIGEVVERQDETDGVCLHLVQ
uniref:PurM-like C-terminal domain-containing protein n=1 Tax=Rhizochromulina marina TaxID=1034831 RepID=A0A7S2R953_9STRA